ncbi:MAG: ATP-binding response regulator [Luteibaculaceae bacterium]
MFGLKAKIILLTFLAAITLIGLSYFSLVKLNTLNKQLFELSKPNNKWDLFQDIATDINKLNTLFLKQSFENSIEDFTRYEGIINDLKKNIKTLKSEFPKWDTENQRVLDTIPVLLDFIQDEFLEISNLRSQQQKEVYRKLESELLTKLSGFNLKDSLLIVEKISYEVRRRNIPDSIFVVDKNVTEENKSLLSRLFTKERPQNPTQLLVIEKPSDIVDTLFSASADTISLGSQKKVSEEEITQVISKAFSNYYRNEVRLLERIRQTEQSFYNKITKITLELDELVNDLRFSATEIYREEAEEVYKFSAEFRKIILYVLVFFTLLSIALIFLVLRDINKNKKYQEQILFNERKAKKIAAAKQEFLATMSHELRTPLTSIIGYTELLDSKDENTKAIRVSSKHLLQVVNEVLDMAKIEAGIIEVKPNNFNLKELSEDIKLSFETLIRDTGIKPNFILPKQDTWLFGDEHRIRQVLYNLMHNALKFTETGEIELLVEVIEKTDNPVELNIAVSDTGIGIPESEQKQIFNLYQQAGTHKNKNQGTGLGLGIVKKILEQMGGSITVISEPGKGSTFSIALKLDKGEPTENGAVDKSFVESIHETTNLLAGKIIICVDDDPLIVNLYQLIFKKLDTEIITFTNSKKLLQELIDRPRKIDLLISDIKMPGLTGFELLTQLEKENIRPSKVIACTANVLLNDEEKENMKAFDGLVSKPLNQTTLLTEVFRVLDISLEKDFPIAENQQNVAEKKTNLELEQSYSLAEFEEFTMGDKALLQEILSTMVAENEILLAEGFHLVEHENLEALADLIHKVSNRFLQLGIGNKKEYKGLELNLLKGDKLALVKAETILKHWKLINSQIINNEVNKG